MTQAEILRMLLALAAVLSRNELTDKESLRLLVAVTKTAEGRKPKTTQ